jgi:serine/threonine protein kinase
VEVLGVTAVPEGCLVMEFIKHGSLQSYLKIHRETLSHKRLLDFALNIVSGMEYLGCMNIVHRDLAARNILVASENLVKISDFGLAQVMGKDDYYILQTNRNLPIKW